MALQPDLYYRTVADIDLDDLVARGVTALLVDLDNTLVPRNTLDASAETREWIATALDRGLRLCVVSNNWHERVAGAEAALGIPVVGKCTKPLPRGFKRGLRVLRAAASEAAVVGDQIFTDVLGGNLVGATTVLVKPLSGGSDLPHTRLLRAVERGVLKGREPVGTKSGTATTDAPAGDGTQRP